MSFEIDVHRATRVTAVRRRYRGRPDCHDWDHYLVTIEHEGGSTEQAPLVVAIHAAADADIGLDSILIEDEVSL